MSNNPHARATEIERISDITPQDFYRRYIKTRKPVVLTDHARSWPAVKKWSLEFFAALDATVYLEQGNVMQEETTFKETGFKAYIQQLMTASETNDGGDVEYLSVFDIFNSFPQLREDVDFSLMGQYKRRNLISGWIGPSGTVTGYHIDWADNLFVQLYGRKRFYMVSPDQSRNMYPSAKYDSGSTLSQVDAINYDEKRFPKFAKVNALTTTLEPGEMLYNPRGWWHHVESLDKSISVNNFGIDRKGILIDHTREKIKQKLHDYGLYGRKDCTCHMFVDGKRVAR